jgi:CBS domain-containing protein
MNNLHVLPIRVRRILSGDGASSESRTVFCPTAARAMTVADCGDCSSATHVDDCAVRCRPSSVHRTLRQPKPHRILPSAADRIAIGSVMSRNVTCVTADVSIEAVTALFLERCFGAAPVVDEEGYPMGVISKTDLVRRHFEEGETAEASHSSDGRSEREQLGDGMHLTDLASSVVGDVMARLAFTLVEDEPLSRAAAIMATEGVHHLPIVDLDGRVVGILSSLDLARWVATQSGYCSDLEH